MKVFISWSGGQSKQIAVALRDWLPMAIHAVKPYMSDRDNEAGARWGNVVADELEASDFGVVCLTPTNINSRWINFEAGALSKAVGKAHVVPLLFKLKSSDVPPPLSQFMMKSADDVGIFDVLKAMNGGLDAERQLEESVLRGSFDGMWPVLKDKLAAVIPLADAGDQESAHRPDRDLLEEILLMVRSNARRRPSLAVERALTTPTARDWNANLARLREIAGPNGLVTGTGRRGEAIRIISSRLNNIPIEDMRALLRLRQYFNDQGVILEMEVIDEPTA